MIRKILCSLLVAVLILGVVSCGSGGTDSDIQTTAGTDTSAETEASIISLLEERDFDGYKFRILGEKMRDYYFVEEMTGDVVEDAVFERNQTVEQMYNVDLEYHLVEWKEAPNVIQAQVLAGTNDYDLLTSTHLNLGQLLVAGYFVSWNNIPYVNLDQPWYVSSANETYSIGNKYMLLFGEFLESNVQNAWVMMYNMRLTENYGITGLYDTVDNGTWTVDYFLSLISGIREDLNGDGEFGENDFYGFYTDKYAAVDSWGRSFGLSAVKKDSDNYPVLDFMSEGAVTAMEKLYDMYYANDAIYGELNAFTQDKGFRAGSGIFSNLLLVMLNNDEMRAMEDDYGILPYPKYNEADNVYKTHLDGTFSAQMVSVAQPQDWWERTGIITEALNALGYDMVVPALYEVAFKMKLSRDDDSARMLDYVLEGRSYSFDSLDESVFPFSPNRVLRQTLVQNKTRDISSFYASNESAAQAWIESMIDTFNESEG